MGRLTAVGTVKGTFKDTVTGAVMSMSTGRSTTGRGILDARRESVGKSGEVDREVAWAIPSSLMIVE